MEGKPDQCFYLPILPLIKSFICLTFLVLIFFKKNCYASYSLNNLIDM